MEIGHKKYFGGFKSLACLLSAVGLFSTSLISQTVVVESGKDFSAVIDAAGNLYTFGSNSSGQLGVAGAGASASIIGQVLPATEWADLSVSPSQSGAVHVLAIQKDGSLWAWGSNARGQLGDGTQISSGVPVLVDDAQTWVEVAAGEDFSIGRTDDGSVYVWGDNSFGQLGRVITNNPLTDIKTSPVIFDPGNSYLSIAAGLQSGLGIRGVPGVDTMGALYSWGYTLTIQHGQPQGSPIGQVVGPVILPQQILTNGISQDGWTRVESSATICFAFRGGSLWSWGGGAHTGYQTSSYTPRRVGTATDWADVAIGLDHTLALRMDGRLFGWSSNNEGELGLPIQEPDGTYIPDNFYVEIPQHLETGSTFLGIGAGADFSAIYTSDAFLLTGGINNIGQLGDGLTSPGNQYFFDNSTLGLADLIGVSVEIVTDDPTPGDTIDLNVFLQNGGTGPIMTDFELAAVLSPSSNFDDTGAISIPISSGSPVTANIVALGEISVAVSVDLPVSIDAGEYYIVVRADSTDLIDEVFDIGDAGNNNDAATAEEEILSFVPDIQVVSADISVAPTVGAFPIQAGDEIDVTVTLTNEGSGAIPSGALDEFMLRFALAEVADIEDSSVVELTLTLPDETVVDEGLPVGGAVVKNYTFTVPAFGVGSFYLGVQADSDATVVESDEDNNVAFTTTALVEIEGIDLAEALDNFDLDFSTSGDGTWFGSDNVALVGASAFDDDAAISPPIIEGESATVSVTLTETSLVSFSWRSATSNADNKLSFSLLGFPTPAGDNDITGNTDWVTVERIVPGGAQAQWTYTEGSFSEGDRVYLDNVQISAVTEPDFTVDSAQLTDGGQTVESARYVLGTDRLDLSVLVRNQGLTHPGTSADFDVRVYLSRDGVFNPPVALPVDPADDILIYSSIITEGIDQGETSLIFPSISLPLTIPSDTYRLIVVVDEANAVGEVAETPLEFGADVQENNIFISGLEVVEIAALPDLRVSGVNPEPGFYLVGESYDFELTLENIGLSATALDLTADNSGLKVSVVLSQDTTLDESDYIVGQFNYPANLAENGASGSSATFDPDVADVRSDVPIADFLYFGVIIDSDNAVEELNEDNNSTFYPNPHFIFAQVELDEAMEFDELGITSQNNESVPFSGDKPFVGQTIETFNSGADAAQSSGVGDSETAAFETTFSTDLATVLSFNWKVSSEFQILDDGTIKQDTLNFYVNDNLEASIAGEQDWQQFSLPLEAGTYTVRWSYEKDGSESERADAGWVDNFQYQVPDLTITDLDVTAQSLTPGADLSFTFSVSNIGEGIVPETPSYTVDVRLSNDPIWGNDGDVILTVTPEIRSSLELVSGASESYSVTVPIPPSFAESGDFFVGLRVDPDPLTDDESVNGDGVVPEANNVNNTVFTDTALISITPTITVREGIDDQDPDDPDLTLLPLAFGGAGSWFGVDDVPEGELPDGTLQADAGDVDRDDVARSGPVAAFEESYFETQVVGPKVLKYRWKVDSRPGANFLELDINGVPQESISGAIDWDFGFGSFTLGYLGLTTESIPSDALDTEVAAALNALATITAHGGVAVSRVFSGGVYEYTITFNVPGNRGVISFQASTPSRIASNSVSTLLNGTPVLPESQVLAIEPDVYFTLSYKSEKTVDISYLADAAAVGTALNALGTITTDGGVTISDHPEAESALDFLVEFNVIGERNLIVVDATGLRQPVSIEAELNSDRFKPIGGEGQEGDAGTAQIQPLRIGPEITIFVPAGAGAQTIRWTYRKTGDDGGFEDAGWVDQIRLLDFAQPELVLTTIDYVPGIYVLDIAGIAGQPNIKLGTQVLDITVTAQNQGLDLAPSAGVFTAADLEVRLSEDRIYGNADDIVLGSFAQTVGTLASGQIMSFIGGLPLGDHIPENDYYLIARVDANERIDEFDTENNIFITENRDVTVERRPRLLVFDVSTDNLAQTETAFYTDIIEYDENILYTPEAPVRVRLDIHNVGLDNLFDENGQVIPFRTVVNLVGVKRSDLDAFTDDLDALEDGFTDPLELGDFTIAQAMEGRSAAEPDGDIVSIDVELTLPTAVRLDMILEDDLTIESYAYFIQVIVDADDAIPESGLKNTWNSFDITDLMTQVPGVNVYVPLDPLDPFPIFSDFDEGLISIAFLARTPTNEAAWEALYGGATADEAGTPAEQANFLSYAFARTPDEAGRTGNQFPGSFGFETENASEYLSMTFDIVAGATDLTYVVEAADDVTFVTNQVDLVTIQGPFLSLVGAFSLTGDGGLISDAEVTSVVDEGYSARVTVIDDQPVSAGTSRFIRIRVETLSTSSN